MKGAMGFSIPDQGALEFVRYLREFDTSHQGCVFNLCTDVRLPPDKLHETFARIAPRYPVLGIKLDRDSDEPRVRANPVKLRLRPSSRKTLAACLPSPSANTAAAHHRSFQNSPQPGCGWSALSARDQVRFDSKPRSQ
jgi:hypothetical protein